MLVHYITNSNTADDGHNHKPSSTPTTAKNVSGQKKGEAQLKTDTQSASLRLPINLEAIMGSGFLQLSGTAVKEIEIGRISIKTLNIHYPKQFWILNNFDISE